MSERKRKVVKLCKGKEEKNNIILKLLLKYIEIQNRNVGK